ncbi:MAG: GNAT family N-acetyltransferase [Dehalococcoidia bacterium]
MNLEIRPIQSEEFETFFKAGESAFGETNIKHLEDERAILDFERTLAAFDGEDIVSTAAAFDFDLTVPGNQLPTAGVTWVGVRPTHRRQGVLTRMMERQLNDIHERSQPVAALWASESLIYGRFGYGLGALGAELKIERGYTNLRHSVSFSGRCRLVSREEAISSWPEVYRRRAAEQPGMYSRTDVWWKHHSLRHEDPDKAKDAAFYVQYEEDGEPLGYARYTTRAGWHDNFPDGKLNVWELVSLTDGAYSALWSYILGVDLMSSYHAERCRLDEPLFWMLEEPRRLVIRPYDALWVRLVDVPAALEARTYASEGSIVLDIDDPFCPWNDGRYQLDAGPDGARCKPTTSAPDLTLTAADLAAVYLGGPRVRALAQAGRVEGDAASVQRADRLFAWDVTPWCPEVF